MEYHLPCVDDFARFGAASRNGAGDGGFEFGVTDPILRYFKLCLGVIDRRLRGMKPLLGLVEQDLGREAARQECFLTLKGVSVLDQPGLQPRTAPRGPISGHSVRSVDRV